MSVITYFKNSVQKNPVLKSVGVYTSITFLNKGISFLLLFIYTNPKFILPAENGLLNLFASSVLFLMPFLSMGILQSTSTDFYKLNKEEFKSFFTANLISPVIIFILSLIGFFLLKDYLKAVYGFPYIFFFLIPLITFLNYISEQLTVLMRVNHELKSFARVELAKIILEFGLSVILVVFFAMRWKGRLTGIVISYSLLGVYAFYYFYKKGYLGGILNKQYIKNELLFAVPVIAMQVSIFCLNTSDKFFLARFQSNEAVGIYGVACTFAAVISMFCYAYLSYLSPSIYKELSKPVVDYKHLKKNFINYVKIMFAVTVLIILIIPFVYRYLINSRYESAVNYFYLIALGYFIWSITSYFYSYLYYYKAKRKILQLSLFSITASIFCIFFFTREMGAKGAAIGILLSYAVTFGLTLVFAQTYIKKIFNK
ncbi:MAG: oligosaccharide flippase family protein [Bacteroidota bacterium]|nr:oligosaccharide flippase family protein [Bacteroidota bacterium]